MATRNGADWACAGNANGTVASKANNGIRLKQKLKPGRKLIMRSFNFLLPHDSTLEAGGQLPASYLKACVARQPEIPAPPSVLTRLALLQAGKEIAMPILRWLLHGSLLVMLPLALLAISPSVNAQVPKGDAFAGYSRTGTDTFYSGAGGLNGWAAALHLKVQRFIGLEGDVAHYGMGADSSIPRTTTILVRPRVTVGAAGIHLFAHGLIGGEHSANGNGISGGAMALALGAGADLRIAPFFAWRVAADYLSAPTQSPGSASHDRFSTDLVFRF
jgi:hypothetical protein